MSGIAARHAQVDATVGTCGIEPFALPAVTLEHDVESAVHRFGYHIPVHRLDVEHCRYGRPPRRVSGLSSVTEERVQGVGANPLSLPKNVALHGLPDLGTAEPAFQAKALKVQGQDREVIMVQDLVVPRRAGTIVAPVVALHLLVPGKPVGVAVDASNPM